MELFDRLSGLSALREAPGCSRASERLVYVLMHYCVGFNVDDRPLGVDTAAKVEDAIGQLACRVSKVHDGDEACKLVLGIAQEEIGRAVREENEAVLAKVWSFVLEESGLFNPPTLWEQDANLERAWDGDDKNDTYRVYPEILIPKINDRVIATNPSQHDYMKSSSKIELLVQHFAPNLLENKWIRDVLSLKSEASPEPTLPLSTVRCVAWHKYEPRVAIVFEDCSMRVFDVDGEDWDDELGALTHEFQRNVKCLEWQPLSRSCVALGCEHGICIWMDGLKWMSFLQSQDKSHSSVDYIAWSPNGRNIASATSTSGNIDIWDVATRTATTLRRVRGYTSSLLWSPNSYYLYAGTTGVGFRVWETKTWECEVWSDFHYPVHCASWSGDEKQLLVVTTESSNEDPTKSHVDLYAIEFPNSPPTIEGKLLPVTLELGTVVAQNARFIRNPAPKVKQLAWNESGERLAVTFCNTPAVALYSVKREPILNFLLMGYAWGPPGSIAQHIGFKPKFQRGALLLIVFVDPHCEAFSQTSIRFVPMYF
uniref:Aladin seven-bladed propeller domain-containing protein n=1 Tax=Mucochytrium quahogii TaxID=96639 RepID=A0A7S2W2L4_9STRA|mmetsp:Transcript_34980/g.55955  ORF Transcript_34980/g.55955 Transcript_34980/m.55955 type:complete len:539 (-) Transcript_34980:164-1780(-)